MKIVDILENESLLLNEEECILLSKIKEKNNDLPFSIIDNKLVTNDYIVGEIQIENTLIRISPRHNSYNLSHFFEMLLYVNSKRKSNLISQSYDFRPGFGIDALLRNYLNLCSNLLDFGLTGTFIQNTSNTFTPKGRIDTSFYTKKTIAISGIKVEADVYELNNLGNQIIKSTLIKLASIDTLDIDTVNILSDILSRFSLINEYQKKYENLDHDVDSFFSTNPYYSIVLEYSIKILKDFKLGHSSSFGGVSWNIFLENSNNVFEKYVRIILERELRNNIQKWDTPKKFAEIYFSDKSGYKSYSPDILIDFNGSNARAVFDVKNKKFEPKSTNLSEIVDLSDIYQLLFYSNQLKSEVCGLIFPTSNDINPIQLNLQSIDTKFFLVGINMKDNIGRRNENLVKNISSCLNYT